MTKVCKIYQEEKKKSIEKAKDKKIGCGKKIMDILSAEIIGKKTDSSVENVGNLEVEWLYKFL